MYNLFYTSGTREQAFVYALASASLTHAIARACSIGITTKCSCGALPNEAPQGDFKWGGCGDDLDFGLDFSRIFVGDEVGKKKKAMMNRHNSAAGRKVISPMLIKGTECTWAAFRNAKIANVVPWTLVPDDESQKELGSKVKQWGVSCISERIPGTCRFFPLYLTKEIALLLRVCFSTKLNPYEKGFALEGKNLLPKGANSFLLKWNPFSGWMLNNFSRTASSERTSFSVNIIPAMMLKKVFSGHALFNLPIIAV